MGELRYAPMPSPHHYDPLEGVKNLFKSLFSEPEVKTALPKDIRFPEFGDLYDTEKFLISSNQVEELLTKIRSLVMPKQAIGYEVV